MVATQQERQQVEAVIQEWKSAFEAKNIDRIKALWDQDYPQLLYIAEENNDHLSGWAAIDNYYNAIPGGVESMDWTLDNLTVDVIGDAAYAYVNFHVEAVVKDLDKPMIANGRDTFVLRKTGGQWKIIHYHESLSRDHNYETWGFLWS
jgi:uncharacterized protein (TIGR02246 family)